MDRKLPFVGRIFWKVLVGIAVLAVVGWTVIVKVTGYEKLPFVGRIFWKVLVGIAVLAVVGWTVIVKVTGYEVTPADYGGSTISGLIFAYLVHLWLLPQEEPPSNGE